MQRLMGSIYVNDFNLFGKTYQVNRSRRRAIPRDAYSIASVEAAKPPGRAVHAGRAVKIDRASAGQVSATTDSRRPTSNGGPAGLQLGAGTSGTRACTVREPAARHDNLTIGPSSCPRKRSRANMSLHPSPCAAAGVPGAWLPTTRAGRGRGHSADSSAVHLQRDGRWVSGFLIWRPDNKYSRRSRSFVWRMAGKNAILIVGSRAIWMRGEADDARCRLRHA